VTHGATIAPENPHISLNPMMTPNRNQPDAQPAVAGTRARLQTCRIVCKRNPPS